MTHKLLPKKYNFHQCHFITQNYFYEWLSLLFIVSEKEKTQDEKLLALWEKEN